MPDLQYVINPQHGHRHRHIWHKARKQDEHTQ